MAYEALLFGTDDMFNVLKPFYDREVQRGNLKIVGYALLENGKVTLVDADGKPGGGDFQFDLAIISSQKDFYNRVKFLESRGITRDRIIDGGVFFKASNLDFPRLLAEGVAYSSLETNSFSDIAPTYGTIGAMYPRVYKSLNGLLTLKLDTKGYIGSGNIVSYGFGLISVGKFTSISVNEQFKLSMNADHDYRKVSTVAPEYFGWPAPEEFKINLKHTCKILIGNDVWIGRESTIISNNPDKPLIIGDGAVIAADSVVVKSVPPYAIVGGNPAQIIKYRFPPRVIKALLRIKWWDWDIEKIHDNFKYFNDIKKFIALHDK